MAAAVDSFVAWLGNKLKELNTDEGVFGSYITSILDCDDSIEEKTEALQGILSEIIENESDLTQVCDEILEMYVKLKPQETNGANKVMEDVDVKLAKMLESQCLATTKQKVYTAEEKKIREAILSQYSQMTDDEEDEEDTVPSGDHHKDATLAKNLNAHSVHQAEREKREQSRLDSQKKKEKDREDREKQKQMKEEKKEKRKTQKGERRR